MHSSLTSLGLSQRRCAIVLILAVVMCSIRPASAAINDTTTIVIVGTVHAKTDKFTIETLKDILGRVKPDLILVELDSSFFTPSMTIKPEFVHVSLENSAVAAYQGTHGAAIRPYDIEGRNKIYQDHNYFKLQQEFSRAINKADEDSLLHGESLMLLEAIDRFDRIGQAFGSESPTVINSTACDLAMESKQYYAGEGMVKIASSVPALKQFTEFATFRRDFWITRNEAMVTNILRWSTLMHPKIIIVICGYEHRYYLRNSLKAPRTPGAFKVSEYWAY